MVVMAARGTRGDLRVRIWGSFPARCIVTIVSGNRATTPMIPGGGGGGGQVLFTKNGQNKCNPLGPLRSLLFSQCSGFASHTPEYHANAVRKYRGD